MLLIYNYHVLDLWVIVTLCHFSPIARRIETALKKYVCLLPSTSDLSYANVSDSSGNTWIHMDKCIFVPFNVAFSSDCGGLQLFRNLSSVFQNDSNFCHTKFGKYNYKTANKVILVEGHFISTLLTYGVVSSVGVGE